MDDEKLKEACDALLAQIGRVLGYEDGEVRGFDESQLRLIESWQVGRLILETEQRRGFGEPERGALMQMLSTALNKRDFKRFGRRNVFYMRKFAREYTAPTGEESLSWSHYRALLSVENATQREALAQRAIASGLSVRELEHAVMETVGFGSVSEETLARGLSVASRKLGVYKVVRNAEGTLMLDTGFGIWVNVGDGALDGMLEGAYVHGDKKRRNVYAAMPDGKRYRYAYEAYVLRVVDGDTLLLEVVLGANTRGRLRLRLRGVNAMEAGTTLGERATRFVRRRLKTGKQVLIHTYGNDIYGRYVADVFYCRDGACSTPSEGIHLNREMVVRQVVQFRM